MTITVEQIKAAAERATMFSSVQYKQAFRMNAVEERGFHCDDDRGETYFFEWAEVKEEDQFMELRPIRWTPPAALPTLFGVAVGRGPSGTDFYAVLASSEDEAKEAVVESTGGEDRVSTVEARPLEALLSEQYEGLAILGTE